MRYSRFNEDKGLYEIFEDGRGQAMNGDLPIPQLGVPETKIGIAARAAGRTLPTSARRVGESWHPVGQLVTGSGAGALGSVGEVVKAHPVLTLLGAGVVVYGLMHYYVNAMTKWGER